MTRSFAGRGLTVTSLSSITRLENAASSVYEQQAVECVTKLYSANGQIRSISAASVPSFDGCLIESLPTSTNIEWNREHFNGQNYYTAVISRSLLYPQRGGELSIGGGEYTVNVYREMIVHDFPFSRRVMDDKEATALPCRRSPLRCRQYGKLSGSGGQSLSIDFSLYRGNFHLTLLVSPVCIRIGRGLR